MKIIKQLHHVGARGLCEKCSRIYELQTEDMPERSEYIPAIGVVFWVRCPQCENMVVFARSYAGCRADWVERLKADVDEAVCGGRDDRP